MPAQPDYSDPPIFNALIQNDVASILEDWAGEIIFHRGTEYFMKKRVSDLAVTKDARLLATVAGTRKYVSALYLDGDGEPAGDCTCPYDGVCKHIVALALAAREALLQKKTLPLCDDLDFRPEMLAALYPESTPLVSQTSLREALARLSRDALLELLLKACQQDRNILLLCAARADPHNIGIQAIINDAGIAIAKAACSPDFDNDYSSAPDYNAIAKKLRTITAAGKPDMSLHLATEVFNTCSNVIELYDHDGEVVGDVGEVAEAGAEALREVDWLPAKKLIWAINAILKDNFGYCEHFNACLHEISDSSAWAEAADYLARQTQDVDSWKKSTLTDLRKLALEKAGRLAELLRLYESEAKESNDYLELVDYLLGQGKEADAETWIKKGLQAPISPYDARELRKRLIRIREKERNHDAIIALQTEIFVDLPDVNEYEACIEAAKAVSQEDVLKPLLKLYLTDGKLPWLEKSWPCENKGSAARDAKEFPLYAELTEIALHENQPLEALMWHDQQRKSKRGRGISEVYLAEAIKDAAPERAFAIWQREAERLIAVTSTRSYFEAGRYLEKMLAQAAKRGEKNRCLPYLRTLREQHKRKRNFIKILDAIEQGKQLTGHIV